MNLIRYLLLTNYVLNCTAYNVIYRNLSITKWGNGTISMNRCNYYSLKPVK